jgi:hypothetical protein
MNGILKKERTVSPWHWPTKKDCTSTYIERSSICPLQWTRSCLPPFEERKKLVTVTYTKPTPSTHVPVVVLLFLTIIELFQNTAIVTSYGCIISRHLFEKREKKPTPDKSLPHTQQQQHHHHHDTATLTEYD